MYNVADNVLSLHNISFMYHAKGNMHSTLVWNDMLEYFESLKLSNADCIQIAELTKGQIKNQNLLDC